MKVTVDLDVCAATGGCAALVPEVFEIRDDGYLYVVAETPDVALRDRVVEAADLCPTAAITVDD